MYDKVPKKTSNSWTISYFIFNIMWDSSSLLIDKQIEDIMQRWVSNQ